MKHVACLVFTAAAVVTPVIAQAPEITAWRLNLDGATGYSPSATINNAIRSVPADVQRVGYNSGTVYVLASTVPSHSIGPFGRNPNMPGNNNAVFRITRNPRVATSPSDTPLGPIGVCVNGVPVFNAKDARSYFNQGIWNQNAIVVEAPGFDPAMGHPAPGGSAGLYHYHQLPTAVLQQEGETWGAAHSPLIGYSFDGYPIYGPYGFANPNGSGGVVRMDSSYRMRNITQRTTLPGGAQLSPSQYGPPVSGQYPLGYFIEDFEYVAGLGHLDDHNGRFAVTPEYPGGVYAYFSTIDAQGDPSYPFIIGPQYRGVPTRYVRGLSFPTGLTPYEPQVQETGVGCGGSTLVASGSPTVPNPSFALSSSQGPANGAVAYIFGVRLAPLVITVFQCPLFVDMFQTNVTVSATLSGAGDHTLALPIPNNAALVGLAAHVQSFAANAQDVETSNAVTLLFDR